MIKAGMSVAEAILQLTRGFKKVMGRNPDGLEQIKIQQEAVERLKNLEKVVDMEGNVIDTSKGIMGGKQIQDNKEFGEALKKYLKDKDPEDMATGGRAGFANGSDDIRVTKGLRSDPEVAKQINEFLMGEAIKKQPEGVLMDPPPEPNYGLIEEMIKPKKKGLIPDNIIEFDDGTLFYKDTGEYYDLNTGKQTTGPSKGAKIVPKILEAAEGGRIGLASGTQFKLPFGKPDYFTGKGKNRRGIYIQPDGTRLVVPIGPDDLPSYSTGGRAGFADGSEDSGAPSIRLEPRVSGIQTEQTVAPGITESVRDIDYGLTALLKGDKFYGGASLDKGKVKVDVETEDGQTLFKDSIGKDDAINFIVGMGQRDEGNRFEIKVDDDFENMNVIYKKTFAEGGRIGLKDGPDMPGRRKFMKIMGGLASLPIVGKFVKPAMPLIQKGAEISGPALDKIIQTVMSAGKLISQSGRRVKEMVTKKKLKDVEVEEDIMDGPSYTIKTKDKTIYYRPGRQDEMGIEDDIIEVLEDTVTKKAGGGIARMLGE